MIYECGIFAGTVKVFKLYENVGLQTFYENLNPRKPRYPCSQSLHVREKDLTRSHFVGLQKQTFMPGHACTSHCHLITTRHTANFL